MEYNFLKNITPEPWLDMPKEGHLPYKCELCGYEFADGYRFHPARGVETLVCNDCVYEYIRDQADILGSKFIRSDDDILNEYLMEWWKGLYPAEQCMILRSVYEDRERNKDFFEPEFAEDHRYYFDWAMSELEGEKLG